MTQDLLHSDWTMCKATFCAMSMLSSSAIDEMLASQPSWIGGKTSFKIDHSKMNHSLAPLWRPIETLEFIAWYKGRFTLDVVFITSTGKRLRYVDGTFGAASEGLGDIPRTVITSMHEKPMQQIVDHPIFDDCIIMLDEDGTPTGPASDMPVRMDMKPAMELRARQMTTCAMQSSDV